MFKDKTVLITGGTGSFGKAFTRYLLSQTEAKKVIIFSRDEFKQHQLQQEIPDPRLRCFLGDVRDLPRLMRAFHGVDIVLHAAALKQVPALEYNPSEAVKTNVLGSQNVIDAAIDMGVAKVLLISTDKAAQPVNLYGATKLCAEKLFISGNSYAANTTLFSVVRYGNVMGSRGSIIDLLLRNPETPTVKITHPDMSRFWITLPQSIELVRFALENMEGGELFVPKIPSMKIVDIFEVMTPNAKIELVGIRPGEKIHETLLTEEESRHAYDLGKYFVVLPEFVNFKENAYAKYLAQGQKLDERYRFSSDTNPDWITKQDLTSLIKESNG